MIGGPEAFTNMEAEWLADLITEKLNDEGIEAESFSFHIQVEYLSEEEE